MVRMVCMGRTLALAALVLMAAVRVHADEIQQAVVHPALG
jgi:hypothetical protein